MAVELDVDFERAGSRPDSKLGEESVKPLKAHTGCAQVPQPGTPRELWESTSKACREERLISKSRPYTAALNPSR